MSKKEWRNPAMTAYKDLSREELLELKNGLEAQFAEVKANGAEAGYVQRKTGG